jgi:peptidoglycan/LPS O-acetylase OafA/YrhL
MNARATRFPLFDSLRAIAALCVFGTHAYFVRTLAGGSLSHVAGRLDIGVRIFFVISGFLLYRPFVKARFAASDSPDVRAYAWRRFLRIIPAYWVALVVVVLWLGLPAVDSIGDAPWYFGFAQIYRTGGGAIGGLPQAWSLGVEISFYIFLPLYALVMRRTPGRSPDAVLRSEIAGVVVLYAIALGWGALVMSQDTIRPFYTAEPIHLWLPAYLNDFAVGICFAVLSVWYQDRKLPRPLQLVDRYPSIPWAVAIAAFAVVCFGIGLPGGLTEHPDTAQYFGRMVLYNLVALGVVMPAVFGRQDHGLVRRFLALKPLLYVGLISYSFFLIHMAVLEQVNRWDPAGGWPVYLLAGLAGSVLLATIGYYLVERPALSLKRLLPPRTGPVAREALAEPAPVAPPEVAHTG